MKDDNKTLDFEMIDVSTFNNKRAKKRNKLIIYIIILLLSSLIISLNVYMIYTIKTNSHVKLNQIIYNDAIKFCSKLFEDNMVKDNIYDTEIDRCLYKIDLVENKKSMQKLEKKAYDAKEYINLKEKIDLYYIDGTLTSKVTIEDINNLLNYVNSMDTNYKNLAISQIDEMRKEYGNILNSKNMVNNLFSSTNVRQNVTRAEYNDAKKNVDNLNQVDLKEELNIKLNEVNNYIEQREKQEYERQQKINNAWVKLNVPYISQNKLEVYNGCEAASLLMALKYKGYLKNVDLITFAKNMPKSNDPNTGFYLDIFDIEPLNESHWIAPEPLVKYGISSSGNQNIINSTGLSLEELSNEILNRNPVIIYLTSKFNKPTNWVNGMAKNLHVLLITGYNSITKEFIITDPWLYSNGTFEFKVKVNEISSIYNEIGKKSIIVR